MSKPRVIIADLDVNYVIPLQTRFIEEFLFRIDLEIITDKDYFQEMFLQPQKADVLIVSESLFQESLLKHGIGRIYVLTETFTGEETSLLAVEKIFKYTSVKEIFNQVVSTCLNEMNGFVEESKNTKVIVVCSGKGGLGKTAVSLGIAGYLAQNYKKVLYLNAAELQNFHAYMENALPITDSEVYVKLGNPDAAIYSELKYSVRKELFYYLPPFKAPLFSMGLKYSIYLSLIKAARASLEYDYVIVDVDTGFNDDMMQIIDFADKVLVVTAQDHAAVLATNRLAENIGGMSADKYLFVCNNYDGNKTNKLVENGMSLKFSVGAYISRMERSCEMCAADFASITGIDKVAYHLM